MLICIYVDPAKKRVRSTGEKKSAVGSGKAAAVDEDDVEDEAPAAKRPRKARKIVEEEDDDEDVDEVMEDAPSRSSKTKDMKPAKPVKAAKSPDEAPQKKGRKPSKKEDDEDEEEEEDEVKPAKSSNKSSKPAKNAFAAMGKKNGAKTVKKEEDEEAAAATASEIEEDAEEDEEDEDPKSKAKARKVVQTVLKSDTKDPFPDWKPGEPVPYAALCTTFSLVELTTKRLIIMEYCSRFLRQVLRLTPGDLLPTVLLMINKLAPDYSGIELGIGESLIMKAIGESTGRSLAVIKQDQKEIGDLGLVAVKSRSTQPTMFKPKALTVQGVHKGLMAIATVSGNGAQQRKVDMIKKLLSAADSHSSGKVDISKDKGGPSEAKYITRFLEGKLRLGLAERTVLVSLAQAMIAHETPKGKTPSTSDVEKAEQMLKTVYR